MKKVLLSMAVVAFLAACGGGSNYEAPATDSTMVDTTTVVEEAAPMVDTTAVDTAAAAEAPAAAPTGH